MAYSSLRATLGGRDVRPRRRRSTSPSPQYSRGGPTTRERRANRQGQQYTRRQTLRTRRTRDQLASELVQRYPDAFSDIDLSSRPDVQDRVREVLGEQREQTEARDLKVEYKRSLKKAERVHASATELEKAAFQQMQQGDEAKAQELETASEILRKVAGMTEKKREDSRQRLIELGAKKGGGIDQAFKELGHEHIGPVKLKDVGLGDPVSAATWAIPGGALLKGGIGLARVGKLALGAKAASTGLKLERGRNVARGTQVAAKALGGGSAKKGAQRAATGAATLGKVSARAGKTWKARKPAVLSKSGRQVSRRKRAYNISQALAANPLAAVPVASVGGATIKAAADDPGQFLETTGRVVPGMATAALQLPLDLAAAVGGDTEALKGQWEGQKDYWNMVSGVVTGKGADVEEPVKNEAGEVVGTKTVHKSPEELIQEDLGAVPALSGGLTGYAALRGRVGAPRSIRDRRIERLERQSESPDRAKRKRAKKKLAEMEATGREKRAQRSREKKRGAATGERIEGRFTEEMYSAADGKKRRRLDRDLERLNRESLNEKVTKGDVVQALGREGWATPAQVRAEAPRRRAELQDPTREIDPDEVATRDVLEALEKNPEIINDPKVRGLLEDWADFQEARSIERHSERTGERQTTPDPEDERARRMHQARAEKVPLEEERIPHELRPDTPGPVSKVVPKKGHDVEKQVRGEAKSLRKSAARFRSQAESLRRGGKQQSGKEGVGLQGDPRLVKNAEKLERKADEFEARAEGLELVVNRKRRAASLDRKATKAQEAGDHDEAARLFEEAKEVRREDLASHEQLRDEFIREAEVARAKAQKREPIFFKEVDVANRGALNVLENFPAGRLPKKEQRRLGTLAEQGRIDEAASTLLENAYRERAAIEMRAHVRGFLDDWVQKIGDKIIRSGPEWRQMQREGKLPPGTALFPVQEFNRALQRGAWDEAAGLLDDALRGDIRETRLAPDRKYAAVPEAALTEFRKQMDPYGKALRTLRASARLQSLGLLALSPAWFSYQLLASPLAAVVAHPNPVAWARAMKAYHTEWKDIPAEEKIDFQAQYGGTSADAIAYGRIQIGMQPDTVRQMSTAAGVALRSPAGRAMTAIWDQMRKGGPLISANRAYESKVRDLVALMEMDKQIRNPKATMRFIGSVGGLHELTVEHLKELQGKSLRERVEFYNRNAVARNAIGDALDDALGNWNALSHAERVAAATTVFYPFLRFSLRWLFISMGKNRPITTAVLLNLAQKNAEELEAVLGGAPSFWPDYANIVTHTGENGEAEIGFDATRLAPGANSIVEGLAQGGFSLPGLLGPIQPVAKTILTAAAGQDPLTGRESSLSKPELIARGIVGLAPPARPLANKIGEKGPYSELFKKITGRDGSFDEFMLPHFKPDTNREQEAARASRLMDTGLGETGEEASRARAALAEVFRKYGLEIPSGLPGGSSSSGSSSESSGAWWGGSSSSSGGSSSSSSESGWWK